ncbi:MAG: RsbP [Pseudomonadota bacterium]|jgi:serine phosphatase RsbU (regulator of sigma subunit)/HAMP domain-containing protein
MKSGTAGLFDFLGYLDVEKIWKKTALRSRIAISASFVLLILLTGFSIYLYQFLKEDKQAYALDTAFAEGEAAALSATQEIYKQLRRLNSSTLIPHISGLNANKANLVRWPLQDEIFFSKEKDRVNAFLLDDEGTLVLGNGQEILDSIIRKVPPTSILVTTTGDVLHTAGRDIALVDSYVREFMSSGVKKGVHSFFFEDTKKTFSFNEVASTNIILVTDALVEEAENIIRKLSMVVFLILSAMIGVSSAVTVFFVRRSLAPLNDLKEATSQYAHGIFNNQVMYPFKDEIGEIFSRVETMRTMLQVRDKRLNRTSEFLGQVLQMVRNNVSQKDAESALNNSLELLLQPEMFPVDIVVSFFKEDFKNEFLPRGKQVQPISKFFAAEKVRELIDKIPVSFDEAIEIEDDVYIFENNKLIFISLQRHPISHEHRGWILLGPLTTQLLDVACINFLGAFATSMRSTLESFELKNLAVQQAQLQVAFNAAAQLQENLRINANLPKSVEVANRCMTAESVGGDWIGTFFHEATNTLYCYITDVTGHGLDATLLVSAVRGAVESAHLLNISRNRQQMKSFLPEVTKAIDELIAEITGGRLTMTMFAMSLSLDDWSVEYLNFAHPKPLVLSAGGEKPRVLGETTHLTATRQLLDPLGNRKLRDAEEITPSVDTLANGEILCVYTDGFTECVNQQGEMLGRRKAREIMHEELGRCETLSEALTGVYAQLADYRTNKSLEDDVSLLFVKRSA